MIWHLIHPIWSWWKNFLMLDFFSCFRCQKDYSTLWLAGHSCLRHYCSRIVREIDTKGLSMYSGACKCSLQIVCFIELSCLTSLFYYLLPLVTNISKKLLSKFINHSMNLESSFCLIFETIRRTYISSISKWSLIY
jgi:hypothetical protein